MTSWWNGRLMNWQDDQMGISSKEYLMKWKFGKIYKQKIEIWWTCQFDEKQIKNKAGWWNDKLTKMSSW